MKVKFYQEGLASWLPSNRHAKPWTFFFRAPFPLHQAVTKPTSSLIDSTPPGPQRSFPQSQAEVPRGSQDRGPSRPNDLTPSLKGGFHLLHPLVLCSLSCVCLRCAPVAQRLNGPAPGNHVATWPSPYPTQWWDKRRTPLLPSRTQKPSPFHVLLMSERTHPREVARQMCPRSRVLPFFTPLVSPLTLPKELSFPAAHSWNFGQSILRYAVFCILS